MFDFFKAPDLPPQLQWMRAEEPELLAWTIRARNYNTFVANCMFAFMSVIIMGGTYFVYSFPAPGEGFLSRILISTCFCIIMSLAILSMTHQRMNYAYRFTCSGVEYCKWKDFPKWMLTFLKWFAGISAIFFILLATIDPVFLIGALVGPGGMGLMYLSMAYSKNYQDLHTRYHNNFYHWSETTKATVATNRSMVEIEFSVPQKDSDYMLIGGLYVFFEPKIKDKTIAILKTHLSPTAPLDVGKVDVLNY